MKLVTDGYEFDFAHAVALYKFDGPDKNNAHYHGLSYCMKAVEKKFLLAQKDLVGQMNWWLQNIVSLLTSMHGSVTLNQNLVHVKKYSNGSKIYSVLPGTY